MNEKNQIPINVSTRIKNIKFIDFKLENIDETIKSKLDSSLFGFENSINFRIEPAIKQITLLFSVCVYTDEKKTIKLAELQTIGEFELLNFDDFRNGEQLALPNEALGVFIGVMLSTARGMLILKSENTQIQNAILPLINPMDFFKTPLEFIKD